MSLALCDKIFRHLEQLELLKKNDVVIDFMSGTGRTNILASLYGYKSISIELEDHFIKMEEQNKTILKKINMQQKERLVSIPKRDLESLEATLETMENKSVVKQLIASNKDIINGRIKKARDFLNLRIQIQTKHLKKALKIGRKILEKIEVML